jgi:hypothetical protein
MPMRHRVCMDSVGRSPFDFASAVVVAVVLVSGCSKSATLPSTWAATQMAPELTGLGGAASQSIWQLALKNKSHSTCLFEGFLDVYSQDNNHQSIAEAQRSGRTNSGSYASGPE